MKLIYTLLLAICFQVTNAQYVKLIADKVNANLGDAVTLNDVAYFGANDGINGWELWRSDGTEKGTYMMIDLNKGTRFDSSNPSSFILFNNKFYFIAKPKGSKNTNFYVSDGTISGTKVVAENVEVEYHYELNNELYLYYKTGIHKLKNDDTGFENVIQFKDYKSGKSIKYVTFNSKFYYLIYKDFYGQTGYELVKYDPTIRKFTAIKSFYGVRRFESVTAYYSRDNSSFLATEKDIYFSADDGNYGEEIWKSDGTPEGTKRIADINKGGGASYPTYITQVGKYILFNAFENYVAQNDNKQYAYVYDPETDSLKTFTSQNGKAFKSIGYNHYLLNENKIYFQGEYYIDDPKNAISTVFFHKKESGSFIWNSLDESITETTWVFPNTPRKENEFYYYNVLERFCGLKFVSSINSETNDAKLKYVIPPSYREIQNNFNDSRDLANVIHVKSGIIGSKSTSNVVNYPPSIYGIYFMKKCDYSVEIKTKADVITICSGNTLEVSAELKNAKGNVSLEWSMDPESCGIGDQNKLTYKPKGEGTLFILAKDSSGCYAADSKRIRVIEGSFEAKISGDAGICQGQSKTLKSQTIGGQAPFTYQWYRNGAIIANANKDSLAVTEAGNYFVVISDAIGCSYSTYGHKLESLIPTNTTVKSSKSSNILEPGEKIQLSVTFTNGQTYQWYKNDSELIGETRNILSVVEPGAYKVEIKNGTCSAFSNIISIETITALPLNINFKVFPNPVITTLSIEKSSPADIRIYNLSGILVKQYLQVENNVLDLALLPAGAYIVNVKEGNKNAFYKIVKQ